MTLPKLDLETARLQVKRGAALLDEKRPGWDRMIDLGRLRLASAALCVLGQAYPESIPVPQWIEQGCSSRADFISIYPDAEPDVLVCTANYDAGRYLLGLDDEQCMEHGFLVLEHQHLNLTSQLASYRILEKAWIELIEERQKA